MPEDEDARQAGAPCPSVDPPTAPPDLELANQRLARQDGAADGGGEGGGGSDGAGGHGGGAGGGESERGSWGEDGPGALLSEPPAPQRVRPPTPPVLSGHVSSLLRTDRTRLVPPADALRPVAGPCCGPGGAGVIARGARGGDGADAGGERGTRWAGQMVKTQRWSKPSRPVTFLRGVALQEPGAAALAVRLAALQGMAYEVKKLSALCPQSVAAAQPGLRAPRPLDDLSAQT
jgi:hypothetical protein